MDVGDENSPYAVGVRTTNLKAKGRNSIVKGSPLVERARGRQGIQKAVVSGVTSTGVVRTGVNNSSRGETPQEFGGGGLRPTKNSRRVTADKLDLADVLESLSSTEGRRSKGDFLEPARFVPEGRGRGASCRRRETADFSSVNALLGSSPTATDEPVPRKGGEGNGGYAGLMESGSADGDHTSDFSALMSLIGDKASNQLPASSGPRTSKRLQDELSDNRGAGDSPEGLEEWAGLETGKRRRGGSHRGSPKAGKGAGKVESAPPIRMEERDRGSRNKARSPGRRSGRSACGDLSEPMDAAPRELATTPRLSKDGRQVSTVPAWKVKQVSRGGGAGGDTGDMGSLFAETPSPLASKSSRDPAGDEDGQAGITVDIGAMVADLDRAAEAREAGRPDRTRRRERRMTADKLTVDDLLGQIDDDFPAGAETRVSETPPADSAPEVERDVREVEPEGNFTEQSNGAEELPFSSRAGVSVREEEEAGDSVSNVSAGAEVRSKGKRRTSTRPNSRRLTADLSSLRDLLQHASSEKATELTGDESVDRGALAADTREDPDPNDVLSKPTMPRQPTSRRLTADPSEVHDLLESPSTAASSHVSGALAMRGENVASSDVTAATAGDSVPGTTTPASGSILASTPSTSGGLGQCVADGSALRDYQSLAKRFDTSISRDSESFARGVGDDDMSFSLSDFERELENAGQEKGGDRAGGAKLTRRLTCDREAFEDIVGDLGSTTTSSFLGESRSSRERSPESAPGSSNFRGVRTELGVSEVGGRMEGGASAISSPPPGAMTDGAGDGVDGLPRRKDGGRKQRERRATASPSELEKLLRDLGAAAVRESAEKESETDSSEEEGAHGSSSVEALASTEATPVAEGKTPTMSPQTPTPSPLARRTRSKSPSSAPKRKNPCSAPTEPCSAMGLETREASTEAGSSSKAIPHAPSRKKGRTSPIPHLTAKDTEPPAMVLKPPGSARAPLKSCLSSRKRTRGSYTALAGLAGAPGNLLHPETPDASSSPTGESFLLSPPPSSARIALRRGAGTETPLASAEASGTLGVGGGRGADGGDSMVMETPRRVVFGEPMAAEFNHGSPSNRLTPMPSRDAKTLFPLEKQAEEETDEDEDTAANSAQLAEWDNLELGNGPDFQGFEDVNPEGLEDDSLLADDDQRGDRDVVISLPTPSPSRSRRRQSLGPKSPLGRSMAAFSRGLTKEREASNEEDPSSSAREGLSESPDPSSEGLRKEGLDDDAPEKPQESCATGDGEVTGAGVDDLDASLAVDSRRLREYSHCSNSSMEITENLGSPIVSPAEMLAASGGDVGGAPRGAVKERGGAQPDEDDHRIDPNDSSELAYTLCGSSIRDAASPGPRRASTASSLMDLVSEVEGFADEVMSERGRDLAEEKEDQDSHSSGMGIKVDEEHHNNDDDDDILSPMTHEQGDKSRVAGDAKDATILPDGGEHEARRPRVDMNRPQILGSLEGIASSGRTGGLQEQDEDGDEDEEDVTVQLKPIDLSDPIWDTAGEPQVSVTNSFTGPRSARLATVREELETHSDSLSSSRQSLDTRASLSVFSPKSAARDSFSPRGDSSEPRHEERSGKSLAGDAKEGGGVEAGNKDVSGDGDLDDEDMDIDTDTEELEDEVCTDRSSSDVKGASVTEGPAPSLRFYENSEMHARGLRRSGVGMIPIPGFVVHGAVVDEDSDIDDVEMEDESSNVEGRGVEVEEHEGVVGRGLEQEDEQVNNNRGSVAEFEPSITAQDTGGQRHTAGGLERESPGSRIDPETPSPVCISTRHSGGSDVMDSTEMSSPHGTHERPSPSGATPAVASYSSPMPLSSPGVAEDASFIKISPTRKTADASMDPGRAGSAAPVSRGAGNRPPRPRRNTAGSRASLPGASAAPLLKANGLEVGAGVAGGRVRKRERRATLQTIMETRRRASVASAWSPTSRGGVSPGERRESAAGGRSEGVRRRLSTRTPPNAKGIPQHGRESEGDILEGRDGGHGDEDSVLGPSEDSADESRVHREGRGVDEEEEDDDEEEDEEVPPLKMTVEDLMKCVAPEVGVSEGWEVSSVIVPRDSSSSVTEECAALPRNLVLAMAATLEAAAVEMERKVSVVREHASASAAEVWRFHKDAPVLAKIDRIVHSGVYGLGGVEANNLYLSVMRVSAAGTLLAQARSMVNEIKAGLLREWDAWEVNVLDRLGANTQKALDELSRAQATLAARSKDLGEIESQLVAAEAAVERAEHRADVRSRMSKSAAEVSSAKADIAAMEAEVAELERRKQEALETKSALEAGKVRREERNANTAQRAVSVACLMDLEGQSIKAEGEAMDHKEMVDVQLGLRLWCQPVKLLADEVVLAFAAPHAPTIRHETEGPDGTSGDGQVSWKARSALWMSTTIVELVFDLSQSPKVLAKVVTTKAARAQAAGSARAPSAPLPSVGDEVSVIPRPDAACDAAMQAIQALDPSRRRASASFRLSRLLFEGDGGIFGSGGGGLAVSGLKDVGNVSALRREAQRVEWYVGRAYSLLSEVRDLERDYACTVVENRAGEGKAGTAVLSVELVDWRSRVKLRLLFGVACCYGCCIGGPQVQIVPIMMSDGRNVDRYPDFDHAHNEDCPVHSYHLLGPVDIGAVEAATITSAVQKAGFNRSGPMSLTKAVQAAVDAVGAG